MVQTSKDGDTLRRLRKKLPNLNIHTIYGYGYRLG